jgi:hypothetical protein
MHWIVMWTVITFTIQYDNDYGDLGMLLAFHTGVKQESKEEHQLFRTKEDALDFIKHSDPKMQENMHLYRLVKEEK